MKKTRKTVEQIIRVLRQADSGVSVEQVCLAQNVSAQSYYRWKQKYGGMGLGEAQRLGEMEKENTELKKLLADQLLRAKAWELALEKSLSPERRREAA